MQSLPQPKDVIDCQNLLKVLKRDNAKFSVVDSNNVMLEREHGIYEYSFDDDSCPTNET